MSEQNRIAKKIAESMSEDPQMEPGQADTRPANETRQEHEKDQPEQNKKTN